MMTRQEQNIGLWLFVALIALFLVTAILCAPAQAHSWYSEKTDPVFKQSCCGGSDCASWRIDPGELTAEPAGYRVRLSLEKSKSINAYSMAPIDAVVPWDRVQPSEDGRWHLCIMTQHRDNVRGGIYCLFAPPDT